MHVGNVGMIPNLAGVLSRSAPRLTSYWQTQNNLLGHATLNPQEIFGNIDERSKSVRQGKVFEDPNREALNDFALLVLRNKGHKAPSQFQRFIYAGFSRQAALDVVACRAVISRRRKLSLLHPVRRSSFSSALPQDQRTLPQTLSKAPQKRHLMASCARWQPNSHQLLANAGRAFGATTSEQTKNACRYLQKPFLAVLIRAVTGQQARGTQRQNRRPRQ